MLMRLVHLTCKFEVSLLHVAAQLIEGTLESSGDSGGLKMAQLVFSGTLLSAQLH